MSLSKTLVWPDLEGSIFCVEHEKMEWQNETRVFVDQYGYPDCETILFPGKVESVKVYPIMKRWGRGLSLGSR